MLLLECCRQVFKARVVQHLKSCIIVILVCLKARAEHPEELLAWLSLRKGRSTASLCSQVHCKGKAGGDRVALSSKS